MNTAFYIEDEAAMLVFGAQLATVLLPGSVVFLHGELGVGKTTLVRGFLRTLGFDRAVKSPTYTLVESYSSGGHKVFHFDLYRLAEPDELEYMGIRDYFDSSAICFIEWPERGSGLLPSPVLEITFFHQERGRVVQLSAADPSLAGKIAEQLQGNSN